MTPRYRCPFCGSFSGKPAKDTRQHIILRHRAALELALHPIEAFHDV